MPKRSILNCFMSIGSEKQDRSGHPKPCTVGIFGDLRNCFICMNQFSSAKLLMCFYVQYQTIFSLRCTIQRLHRQVCSFIVLPSLKTPPSSGDIPLTMKITVGKRTMFSELTNLLISSVLTVESELLMSFLYMQADERMVTVCLLTRDSSL